MYIVTIQSKINQQVLARCICEKDYELHDLLGEKTNENVIAIVEWVDTYTYLNLHENGNKK